MVGDKVSLIGRRQYKINDEITINIPLLGEVRGNCDADQEKYYDLVKYFTVTSTDCMVMLYDVGIDFEDITDWQMFLMLAFGNSDFGINGKDLSKIFVGAGIANFEIINRGKNDDNDMDFNMFELVDKTNGIHIDRTIYEKISNIFCQVLNVQKEHRKFGHNPDTLKYIVGREKKKAERNKNKPRKKSDMDSIILALVCNKDFPYDFTTINNITLYEFNQSVLQILKNQSVSNLYMGIYTGNIDTSKNTITQKELSIFMTD